MTDTWEEERDHAPDKERLANTVRHLIDIVDAANRSSPEYHEAKLHLHKLLTGPQAEEAGLIAEEYRSNAGSE